ncbi:MAG: hypothetical protein LBB48_06200 [Treponema sp.]|nr:hypothetical protein [Treponema sp.]
MNMPVSCFKAVKVTNGASGLIPAYAPRARINAPLSARITPPPPAPVYNSK